MVRLDLPKLCLEYARDVYRYTLPHVATALCLNEVSEDSLISQMNDSCSCCRESARRFALLRYNHYAKVT